MFEEMEIRLTSRGQVMIRKKVGTVYGYARVNTAKQKIERQVDNIRNFAKDAVILQEAFPETTPNRPAWNKIFREVMAGDTIVFDEVTRMSNNADEGFRVYKELFDRGVKLVFLKEHHIDTDIYRKAREVENPTPGDKNADFARESVNKALMELARQQIKLAFQTSQDEVDFLHRRTSEGVRKAQLNGKTVGRAVGTKIETKKAKRAKEIIIKYSRDFSGALPDADVLKLTGIDRGTYYKYKKQLRQPAH